MVELQKSQDPGKKRVILSSIVVTGLDFIKTRRLQYSERGYNLKRRINNK